MISRCTLEGHKHYYEKGIVVCDEWKNDFTSFCDWADEYGVNRGTANDRYHKGWKFDEILSKDMRFYHKSK